MIWELSIVVVVIIPVIAIVIVVLKLVEIGLWMMDMINIFIVINNFKEKNNLNQ